MRLGYKGAAYHGWQVQPQDTSVQQVIEEAMATLLRVPTPVTGAGRTDAGVNARLMVAHFDTQQPVQDLDRLVHSLNALLPPDIAIYGITPVHDEAHARFDATARTYQYHVSDKRLPFRQGLYCRIYFHPDLDLMNQGAKILMEYEDFTSFAKLHTQVKTNICHLTEAHWDEVGNEWVFTIRSNRFLRNMVRSVTGTLLDVGRGKLTLDGLRDIIERKNRCAAGVSMPPQGLFLTKVEYPLEKLILDK